MVAAKEKIFEWEPQVRDVALERILEMNDRPIDVIQEKQVIKKSFLKKVAGLIKAKESLTHAIIVNMLILIGLIAVISLFIIMGGLFLDPFLILSILLVILLFTVMEVFKLVEKETRCKNSR
jgi:hypothetical protein